MNENARIIEGAIIFSFACLLVFSIALAEDKIDDRNKQKDVPESHSTATASTEGSRTFQDVPYVCEALVCKGGGGGIGIAPTPPPSCTDVDGDGQTNCAGDCRDNDATIFTGAIDYCGNSVDEDCSGADSVCDASAIVQATKNSFAVGEEVELN